VGTFDGGEEARVRTILKIWEAEPGPIFFLSTRRRQRWEDHSFTRDDFDDLDEFVRDWVEEGYDVYWCCHSFYHRRRLANHAAPSKLLWADLDAVQPQSLPLPPSLAWCTSPGRYAALWRLDGVPTMALRKNFNDAIGADAGGYCLTKVLRVPGTRNFKYPARPLVKFVERSNVVYSLKAFEKEYGTAPDRPARRAQVARGAETSRRTGNLQRGYVTDLGREQTLGPDLEDRLHVA
jgi:hypothetical protein